MMTYGDPANGFCKIKGCYGVVWPSKTLGYCNLHYSRFHTGRMRRNLGTLKPWKKEIICIECDTPFIATGKECHVKACPDCRAKRNTATTKLNYYGVFRRELTPSGRPSRSQKSLEKKKQREIRQAERAKIILETKLEKARLRKVKRISKYQPIYDMRVNDKKTLQEIGDEFGYTREYIRQICKMFPDIDSEV